MKKNFKGLLITLFLIGITIYGVSTITLFAQSGDLRSFYTPFIGKGTFVNNEKQVIRESLMLEPFTGIDVQVINADIIIKDSDTWQVSYALHEDVQLKALEVRNNTLYVKTEKARESGIQIDWGWGNSHYYYIEISMPLDQRLQEVNIRTISGDIETPSIIAQSDISLSTTSGDIEIDSIEAASIQINTISGDIELNHVTTPLMNTSTTSGDIEILNGSIGEFSGKSISGEISLYGEVDTFTMQTTSGDIELYRIISSLVSASTVSGNIDIQGSIQERGSIFSTSGNVTIMLEHEATLQTTSRSGTTRWNGKKYTSTYIETDSEKPILQVNTTSGDIDIYTE